MKRLRFFIFVLGCFIFWYGVCHPQSEFKTLKEREKEREVSTQEISNFRIFSPAFKDKGRIPLKHAMKEAGGQNISIPLKWKHLPPGTRSLAIAMVDEHPSANNWLHWLIVNIPVGVEEIPEGMSQKAKMPGKELKNSYGFEGYGGPNPPKGTGAHPYVITIYALRTPKLIIPNGPADSILKVFLSAIQDKVISKASVVGFFSTDKAP